MTPKPTSPTRRDFLKLSGAVAGLPWLAPSSVLGFQGPAPSSRITTALIGSGSRGQQIIAGGDKVLAVCDVDAKLRQQAKQKIDAVSGTGACDAYADFREVLARDDIDAVVVATPDHWHVPIAVAAVKAGKAVYCEKPLTLTIHEGRVLSDIVRRYGAILQIGSQQRTDEKFILACELVRNGYLGEIKKIEVVIFARAGKAAGNWTPQPVPPELDYDMWLGSAPWAPYHKERCHYNFRFVSDYSGGDMTNWGAHHLDIVQWALDCDRSGPTEVVARGKRNPNGLHDAWYDVTAEYTYPNGVQVVLRSGGSEVRTGGVRFIGTEGSVWVSREAINSEPKPSSSPSIRLSRVAKML